MTRSTRTRLGASLALAAVAVAVAACGGTGSSQAPSSPAAPSMAAESPAASASGPIASPSASAAASPSSAPSASAATRTVQVYALDGAFQNAPIDPAPGTVLTFRNVGSEAHEMLVLRRNDDAADEPAFEDLATLDAADLLGFVSVVGVLAADPGQEAQGQIELTEPGDYVLVDLLAQGTTTAPASPDPLAIPSGVPNVARGMFATFSVVAPEAS